MKYFLALLVLGAGAALALWKLQPAEKEAPVDSTPALTRTSVEVDGDPGTAAEQAPETPQRSEALAKNAAALQALDEGRTDDAILLLEEAVALSPDDQTLARNLSRARLRNGVAALGDGRLTDAAQWFERAAEAHADRGAPRWWTARLLMQQARRDEAAAVLDAALLEFPQEVSLLRLRAELNWLAGDMDAAVEHFRLAAELAPDDTSLQQRRAQLDEERRAFASFLTDATNYFDCRYDPADRDLVAAMPELRADLDAIYLEVVESLGIRPQQRLLVLFLDPERFGDSAPGWSAGLYDGRIRLLVRDPAGQRAQLGATLRHELTHAVLHSLGPQLPTWLHEGLAQQAEGRDVAAARRRLQASGLSLGPGELAQDWTSWAERSKVTEAYAYALSFCAWLPERFGEAAIRNLLVALPGRGFDAAWEMAFAQPWAEVEAEHRRFLLGG